MKNYDQKVEINHNPNWPFIPGHPYRISITGGSGSGKTNVLLIKFICKSKIHSNQSISCLVMEERKKEVIN